MLELDIVLGRFLDRQYDQLSLDQQMLFVQLLKCSDQTLYQWLIQGAMPPPYFTSLIAQIREVMVA